MPFATRYRTVTVQGLEVFYREAGDPSRPTLVLLHGFPASSFMFRELIGALADRFHLVAPDHVGFGRSAMPAVDEFEYTFERLSEITLGSWTSWGSTGSRSTSRTTGRRSACASPAATRTASPR